MMEQSRAIEDSKGDADEPSADIDRAMQQSSDLTLKIIKVQNSLAIEVFQILACLPVGAKMSNLVKMMQI
jgi:hypothetical protein